MTRVTKALGDFDERGIALVAALMVIAIFGVLILALVLQGQTDRVAAVNEGDHLKTLAYAEAGLTWAERRIVDAGGSAMSDLLDGPDDGDTADDNLIGLRDLSLTATNQFTNSNEDTASAIVQRDFTGEGNRTYEVIRFAGESNTRALIYVRVDDNFDDDSDDPSNDDPLTDTDGRVRVTSVAEYPVFVNDSGVETTSNVVERGRARRTVVAEFAGPTGSQAALLSGGDYDQVDHTKVCGDCGSVHANGDVTVDGSPPICGDFTGSGTTFNPDGASVGGTKSGGVPPVDVPVINPFDDVYVPSKEAFDTTSWSSLPASLQCSAPTLADPGNAKYYALVAGGSKGYVYKAYWDFTNDRWSWKMIDDLGDGTNVLLDSCGRAPGDPFYGSAVSDGGNSEFYGFRGTSESTSSCNTCGTAGADQTLCSADDNDFNRNGGFYEWDPVTKTSSWSNSIPGSGIGVLPGSFESDGNRDFDPESRISSVWQYADINDFYDPTFNAVMFIYGGFQLDSNPGSSGAYGVWNVSIIAVGNIGDSDNPAMAGANPPAGAHWLYVSGRDMSFSGNINQSFSTCSGGCPGSVPAFLDYRTGAVAAHEQIESSDNPHFFGFVVVEDAATCSSTATDGIDFSGNHEIYYDCQHPPSPWGSGGDPEMVSWQEVE